MPTFKSYILLFSVLVTWPVAAVCNSLDELLKLNETPDGVVFEIVSRDAGLLPVLLPKVVKDIERLRQRFPEVPVAVVTHGAEQFILMSRHNKKASATHDLVKQLVTDKQVDVHVCGTYAEWRGFSPEDFPDYVNVAAAGPTQIKDYVALGYYLITLH